jgi:transcription elongation factor Elf1
MKDKLTICDHCGSEVCYTVEIQNNMWAYSCTGCGFTANDFIKEGEYDIEQFEEMMPELYKDLKYVDKENRVWYPMVIQNENGLVFIDGTDKENWSWGAIKNRPLTEEEKQVYVKDDKEVPPYKSDSETLRHFGMSGFLQAVQYIDGI